MKKNLHQGPAQERGFTLPEVLIAVSIFAMVSTVAGTLYAQSFKETRRATVQNQLYDDARYTMARIAEEVRNGMIDYDEYYSWNVVKNSSYGTTTYGQNYGRYYSAFFNPGDDDDLGFDCNDGTRNKSDCVPIRTTLDRHTGQNPFDGKFTDDTVEENALCGKVTYGAGQTFNNDLQGTCTTSGQAQPQSKLYLISADAKTKTVLAREKIFSPSGAEVRALSLLRLTGKDTNNDAMIDSFVCAPEFQCRGMNTVAGVTSVGVPDTACEVSASFPQQLPRGDSAALEHSANTATVPELCDGPNNGYSKDFIPVSPLRATITRLDFYITPLENPQYAFAEKAERTQPRVTIVLTVGPNPDTTSATDTFVPVTLVETVSSRVLDPIPAPLRVRPAV